MFLQLPFSELAFNPSYQLTLLGPMYISIKFDTVKSGWFILYIGRFQAIISPKNTCITFLTLNIAFVHVQANCTDPEEISSVSSLFAKVPV